MLFFIFKRLMMLVPTVFGVVTLVFMLRPMIPGDPIDYMLGENAMEADREMLRAQYGLDKSLPRQYLVFLGGLIKGDLGRSIHTRRPVTDMIRERYPATLLLALSAMVVAVVVALPAGIASAVRRNTLVDNLSMLGALLGISMPNFWMGPLLIILFSIHLGWLPVSGMGGPLYLILPAITLEIGRAHV